MGLFLYVWSWMRIYNTAAFFNSASSLMPKDASTICFRVFNNSSGDNEA